MYLIVTSNTLRIIGILKFYILNLNEEITFYQGKEIKSQIIPTHIFKLYNIK